MQLKARLFFLWLIYATLLTIGTGVYAGKWEIILFIYLGSLFGMLLPKFICAASDVWLRPSVKLDTSSIHTFITHMWSDASSLIPRTKTGQMIYSYPFLFAFGIVALYVVTSTSNWFGKTLVLGMALRLVVDLVMSNRDKNILKERWFSAFHTKLSDTELDVFVYASLAFFVLLTVLAFKV